MVLLNTDGNSDEELDLEQGSPRSSSLLLQHVNNAALNNKPINSNLATTSSLVRNLFSTKSIKSGAIVPIDSDTAVAPTVTLSMLEKQIDDMQKGDKLYLIFDKMMIMCGLVMATYNAFQTYAPHTKDAAAWSIGISVLRVYFRKNIVDRRLIRTGCFCRFKN